MRIAGPPSLKSGSPRRLSADATASVDRSVNHHQNSKLTIGDDLESDESRGSRTGSHGQCPAAVLAHRGCEVIGFEQYWRAHNQGSSHGDTRAIRKAHVRKEQYAPLVLEAYDLWRRLEQDTGAELLREIGGLVVAPSDSRTLTRSIAIATKYEIPFEILEPSEVTRRWPTMHPPAGTAAFFECSQSIMPPEKTVATHVEMAIRDGAKLHLINRWFHGGARRRASKSPLVRRLFRPTNFSSPVAPGPKAYSATRFRLRPNVCSRSGSSRKLTLRLFRPAHHPRWVLENAQGRTAYAFPILEGQDAIKMAFTAGTPSDPGQLERAAFPGEVEALVDFMAELVPSIRGRSAARVAACFSGKAQDDNFIIGPHPESDNVIVAAGFGSHGFKFVPVLAEILADLALDRRTRRGVSLFDPSRFGRQA